MSGMVIETPRPEWSNSLAPSGDGCVTLELAVKGRARYRIVLPAEPTTQEQKAADELAAGLGAITGATFEIAVEGAGWKPTGRELCVGATALAPRQPLPAVGDEGYAIAVEDRRVFLAGGRRRGPLNAVFALLEEDLGCRWYAPGVITVRPAPTLRATIVPRSYTPVFDRRDPYYSDAMDVEWSLRNRTSSHAVPIPAAWGGHPKFTTHFVHTYNILMPPEEFFAAHPEYYAEINGVRRDTQLCPTNPDVQRIVSERVLAHLRACPDCNHVDVSPNDWRDYCECAHCAALDKAEGGYAASMLQLVNAVADAVAAVRDDVKISTLAYLGTFMPPRTLRPRDNVLIVLCTDSHAWDYQLLPARATANFSGALEAWSKTGANVMIWEYPADFERYMRPLPNLALMQDNIRLFFEKGATGVLLQASHRTSYGLDRCQLRSWVWAKLLWNPSLETDELVRDFYLGFYGAAAPPLMAYDRLLSERWERAWARWQADFPTPHTPDPAVYQKYFEPTCVFFAWETLTAMLDLMQQARALAAGDPVLTRRVEYAALPVLYAIAEHGPSWEPYDRDGYLNVLNDLERIARREGAIFLRLGCGPPELDALLTRWRAIGMVDPAEIGSIPLSNAWRFAPDPQNVGIQQRWYAPDFDDSKWGIVRSDLGHRGWESQGYADYAIGYGWYRQEFFVPGDFHAQHNPRLFFAGVDEQCQIWLNGVLALEHTFERVGLSKDFLWKRPFLFDPTAHLIPDATNVMAVRVHNSQHVGGIYRPVRLLWGEPVDDLHALDEVLARREKEEAE